MTTGASIAQGFLNSMSSPSQEREVTPVLRPAVKNMGYDNCTRVIKEITGPASFAQESVAGPTNVSAAPAHAAQKAASIVHGFLEKEMHSPGHRLAQGFQEECRKHSAYCVAQPVPHTGWIGRGVYWLKGMTPPEDLGHKLAKGFLDKCQRGAQECKSLGRQLAEGWQQYEMCKLEGSSNTCEIQRYNTTMHLGKINRPVEGSSFVRIAFIGTLVAGSFILIKTLWDRYNASKKPEEQKALALADKSIETAIDDVEITASKQLIKLQRLIQLMDESPKLKVLWIHFLHEQIRSSREQSHNDVKNNNAGDGGGRDCNNPRQNDVADGA